RTDGVTTTQQIVEKGDFSLKLTDANIDLRIRESGADTAFNVAQLVPDSQVVINGGGGDDILQTRNTTANHHQFDLDAIFVGDLFFFDGGGGDNLLDLNDSNGSTPS